MQKAPWARLAFSPWQVSRASLRQRTRQTSEIFHSLTVVQTVVAFYGIANNWQLIPLRVTCGLSIDSFHYFGSSFSAAPWLPVGCLDVTSWTHHFLSLIKINLNLLSFFNIKKIIIV